MSRLTRETIQDIIKEEFVFLKNKKDWEEKVKPRLNEVRNKLLDMGYDRQLIDENFAKSLFSSLLGTGGGAAADAVGLAGSQSLTGELSGGIRTYIEQTGIEKAVEYLGFNPREGTGLILKNMIETSIKQLSPEEVKSLLSGEEGKCLPVADKLTSIAIATLEESAKERLLIAIMDAILGELGEEFKTNSFTRPIYQNIREKFSDAFSTALNDPEFRREVSVTICSNLNIESLLGAVGSASLQDVGETISGLGFDEISSGIQNLMPGLSSES